MKFYILLLATLFSAQQNLNAQNPDADTQNKCDSIYTPKTTGYYSFQKMIACSKKIIVFAKKNNNYYEPKNIANKSPTEQPLSECKKP